MTFKLIRYLLWAGATEEEPSALVAAGLCTTAGAAKTAATDGRVAGTLGPTPAAAIERPTVAEGTTVVKLGPGVEVPAGGVGP